MTQTIGQISLLVKDYDEAIAFYTQKLGFELVEDTVINSTKRWVRIAPPNSASFSLLLARAVGTEQSNHVGNQTGGRVFLFLYTDNFDRDYNLYLQNGVKFVRTPQVEPYGTVAVFEDLYGNLWDLIEANEQ
ncbi:VOC family protein [Mucilaginibacter glaciei]|uniref:VOC family protein n=1 Tax=Mucilaginibacter glaciei TaxID=2772109 RepID=A0A926S166_9SPHI|nr:VOC family protein [Mucilaginibacter glaciei]MBD1392472.1 VOC family protein [Mucilaginibacter glaciei]